MSRFSFWKNRRENAVREFAASDLTPQMLQQFVMRNEPCVVRGAAAQWRGTGWTADYLADHFDSDILLAHCIAYKEPQPREWGVLWRHPQPFWGSPEERFRRNVRENIEARTTLQDWLLSDEQGVVRYVLPDTLVDEVNGCRVACRPEHNGGVDNVTGYSGQWVYLYRGASFTDWHFHPGSEALMIQVVGTKELLLLPPTADNWRRLTPALDLANNSFEIPAGEFGEFDSLEPLHVRVEPGDAVYIPVWWWHLVESAQSGFGVTVPTSWAPPFRHRYDPRVPAADFVVWKRLPRDVFGTPGWSSPAKYVRAALLAALFASGLPLASSLLSGSSFGRRPKVKSRTEQVFESFVAEFQG